MERTDLPATSLFVVFRGPRANRDIVHRLVAWSSCFRRRQPGPRSRKYLQPAREHWIILRHQSGVRDLALRSLPSSCFNAAFAIHPANRFIDPVLQLHRDLQVRHIPRWGRGRLFLVRFRLRLALGRPSANALLVQGADLGIELRLDGDHESEHARRGDTRRRRSSSPARRRSTRRR